MGFLHPKFDLLGALIPCQSPILQLDLRGGPSWMTVFT